MGDRGNIVIEYGEGQRVYLYTHWSGTELAETLAAALDSPQGRNRWNDDSYLARIIFGFLLNGADPKGELSFGISTYAPDNEYDYLVVNPTLGSVRVEQEGSYRFPGLESTEPLTFEDFIAAVRVSA